MGGKGKKRGGGRVEGREGGRMEDEGREGRGRGVR